MNFESRYLKMEVCGQLLTHWTIYTQENSLHNSLNMVLVGPRADLDPSEKRTAYYYCREMNHDSLEVKPFSWPLYRGFYPAS